MFLDIRATLATFVTAIGLALVMFAVGTRAWVRTDMLATAPVEARTPAIADPFERGFGVGTASASGRSLATPAAAAPATVTPAVSVPSFLAAPKSEPAGAAGRMTAPEAAPPVSSNIMPGAVVQERFDVLHEPAPQVVPRNTPSAVGGPLVPLPRPRIGEPAGTPAPTAVSIAGTEHGADTAPPRPKATVGSAKRTDAGAANKKRQRETSGLFGGLFGR